MRKYKHIRLNYMLEIFPDNTCQLSFKSVLVSGQTYHHDYDSVQAAMDTWKLEFDDFIPA